MAKVMMRSSRLTQRAPDWWESARFQAQCVAWSWFRQNGVISSRPPAGNASRWVARSKERAFQTMKKSTPKPTFNIRQELIISDFKTYAEDTRSDRERVNAFRQWEVTVLVAIISFALSQGTLRPYLPIVTGLLIAFAILESINRGRIALRHHLSELFSQKLMTEDDEYILEKYVFASTLWERTPRRVKFKIMLAAMMRPQFIAWNISLVSIVMLLLLTLP
jgi:hypothetical protein